MSVEEAKKLNMPAYHFYAFILCLISSFILAYLIMHLSINNLVEGIKIATLCLIGFTGAMGYT